jgi:hypothetical protein
MTNLEMLNTDVDRVANAIIELVECTDGPVTLPQLDREVRGFKSKGGRSWQLYVDTGSGESMLWEGMTEAGYLALSQVIFRRRIAIQPVTRELYRSAETELPDDENWLPIIMHPKIDANVGHERFLIRVPPSEVDEFIARGGRGYSILKPPRFRSYTRDQYAV